MTSIRWIFIACLLSAIGGAFAVITTSEAKYESVSIIMLKRAQMERAGHSTEDSRNRWVWVRDGLELKNELISEDVLKNILEIVAEKSTSNLKLPETSHLRKTVEIHYSGGDDNLFTIRVQHTDPEFTRSVANAYLEVFPNLAIERRMTALENSLQTMEKELLSKDLNQDQLSRKIEIIETIKSDITLAKAERDQRIVVIQNATPSVRIWPRPLFILVAFGCFGVFIGASIATYMKKTRRNR